eukprot:CAMPEP_0172500228 /NCGR_PEP_ID=MMETSP1066-20121228/135999_1 /TAXON_ID=671091 /ORGANISM="Coscinodiscus wailesii, Strain CCMP2513" /LENGTH=243 /DNA_ID=CAMNT_0013274357 /DNA_START=114 /DNA_END=845 /DNA_ORIENTATION=+
MVFRGRISLLVALVAFRPFARGFAPAPLPRHNEVLSRTSKTLSTFAGLKATSSSEESSLYNRSGSGSGSSNTRRNLIRFPVALLQLAVIGSQIHAPPPVNAAGAVGEKVKALTPEEAEVKFREGYKTINYLIANYDEICDGGGDNVRRYLGTIVSNPPSSLVGIGKAMKALEDRADDYIEYVETSEEVIKSINQADGSAYMAIFVTTSTSYTPPKKYFDDGLIEVKRCKKAMEQLAAMANIKL